MKSPPVLEISNASDLEDFCRRHLGVSPIGFDTEFVRERTYYPRLEIVQIVADGAIAVIDTQAVDRLEPLWDLLCDERIEKIVHSGKQDMELILQESGRLPRPVFDVQIAASLLGFGSQCGYSRLVSEVLRKRIPKGETFSDWSRRPLHRDQVAYAAKDVEHLPALRDALGRLLEEKGRHLWADEECAHLTDPETFRKLPPDECFQKIKGRTGLDPESLSVLRSLAEWRELEAQERDVPPGRVVGDHVLLSIAKSAPEDLEELKRQRGLYKNELARRGAAILAAVRRGIEKARDEPVTRPLGRVRSDLDGEGLHRILAAVVQIKADEAGVSPSVLATTQHLRSLATGSGEEDPDGVPLLHGWRRDIAGEAVLSVLAGRTAIRIDPVTRALRLEEVDG